MRERKVIITRIHYYTYQEVLVALGALIVMEGKVVDDETQLEQNV